MRGRTDLISEKTGFDKTTEGLVKKTISKSDAVLQFAEIKTESAAKKLEKPIGKYFTVRFSRLDTLISTEEIEQFLVESFNALLPDNRENILTVGLGNSDITPDALGPLVASKIIVTRHISNDIKKQTGLLCLKNVSSVIPGVLGKTGIEAVSSVKAIAESIKPSAIIVIDALAAAAPERLCRTFQLTDTGISPGSGVNNRRKAFNKAAFGVPVIAVGMPTVIDYNEGDGMMVTPKDIDLLNEKAAQILSSALNRFLQPDTDPEALNVLA